MMANVLQFLNLNVQGQSDSTGAKSQGRTSSSNRTGDSSAFDDLIARYSGSEKNISVKSSKSSKSNKNNRVISDTRSQSTQEDSQNEAVVSKIASSVNSNNNVQVQVQAQSVNEIQRDIPDADVLVENPEELLNLLFDDLQDFAQNLLDHLPQNLNLDEPSKLQEVLSQITTQFSQLTQSQLHNASELRDVLVDLCDQVVSFKTELTAEQGRDNINVNDLIQHLTTAIDVVDVLAESEVFNAVDPNLDDLLARPDQKDETVFVPEKFTHKEEMTGQVAADESELFAVEAGSNLLVTERPRPTGVPVENNKDNDDDDDNDSEDGDETGADITIDAAQPNPNMLASTPVPEDGNGTDLSKAADASTNDALAIDVNESSRNDVQPFDSLTERRDFRTQPQTPEGKINANAQVSVQRAAGSGAAEAETEEGNEQGLDTDSRGATATGQQGTSSRPRVRAFKGENEGPELADGTLERPKNVRADFQSFFESVLSSRRMASREVQAPLNLQQDPSYNYTESETLRVGITNVVRFVRAQGEQRANIIVDPPALGRISVELTTSSSGVEASVKVANEQIRHLVQDQVVQLRMTLEQQGVQLAHFAVDVQQDDGRQQQQGGRQEQREQGRRIAGINELDEIDDAQEEFRVDLEQGLLYWIA